MRTSSPAAWWPVLGAFVVWLAHFLGCWVAAEVWPRQWQAHAVAWVTTPLALVAIGLHGARLDARGGPGELTRWTRLVGRGTTALAAAAVVFTAVPSLVLRP